MPGEITLVEFSMCLSCIELVSNEGMKEPRLCKRCANFYRFLEEHQAKEDDTWLYEARERGNP